MLMLLAMLSIGSVQAQDEEPTIEERAAELYEAGAQHLYYSEYEEALAAFLEAWDLTHQVDLLYNIAGVYEQMGDDVEALAYLKAYQNEVDDKLSQKTAERRIAVVSERLKQAGVNPKDVAAASVGKVEQPGEVEVEVAAVDTDIEPVTAEISGAEKGREKKAKEPKAAKTKAPKSGPARPVSQTAGYVMAPAGVVMAAGFGITAGVTYAKGRAYRDAIDRKSYEEIRPLNNASVALTAVGLGLAAGGVVLAIDDGPLGPRISPTPGGILLSGSF